jgi:hypothetical protein
MPDLELGPSVPSRKRCIQCGYEWSPRLPDPRVCPNPKCHSTRWNDQFDLGRLIGARNDFVILQVSSRSDDSVTLELRLRNAGSMPNPTLTGPILRSLKRRAANLGVSVADLVGFIIQFDRDAKGIFFIADLYRPTKGGE